MSMPGPSVTGGAWSQWAFSFAVAALLLAVGCTSKASFHGTELASANPATLFTLRDQFDRRVALSDLTGRVVVLTFLYTNCPDVCPLTTDALRKAYDSLGRDAQQTAFVAISVDPARDSVEQVYRYSEQRDMLHKWAFLTGTEEELAPLWQAYYIAAEPAIARTSGAPSEEHTHADNVAEDSVAGYLVDHSAPVYLIDREGRMRVVFTGLTLDPQPLVDDIRLLLG